jgi:predicted transcriptional regulator
MAETSTEERVLLGTWVDRDLADKLDAQARAADRSRASELRRLIRTAVEHEQPPNEQRNDD